MASEKRSPRWRLKARDARMLGYLLVLVVVAAWRFIPRPWQPTITLERPRHIIHSSATQQQTETTAHTLELLYLAYSNRFGDLDGFRREHPKMQVKLFKDRKEFRRVNPGLGWAEAFYREPYCRAYYSDKEANPHHWMLHESVHQLNHEVAGLDLAKWLEEGLATYFSTSRLESYELAVGRIDPNTYPVWWLDEIATSADLEENIGNGTVIPLRIIITNRGGPGMRRHFNLYYLHWWTLTRFIFESTEYRERANELVQRGGGLEVFEEIIGPVDEVEKEWHDYVRRLKEAVASADVQFHKTGRLPVD